MTEKASIADVDPRTFQRARGVFESALESPAADRARIVEAACGDDTRLLAAVQAMLRADAEPHSVLDDGSLSPRNRWPPGTLVGGHFRIVSLLGHGGMGEVYRVHDETLGRDVALKVLPSSAFGTEGLEERLARFEREAQILAALNHPCIAAIYGVAEVEGTRALVLELVEGPTLAERLEAGPIPLDEAVKLARQITVGLEAAHERGVVHRDLKPSNIKLRPDGTLKLLDFGLAKVVQPERSVESVSVSNPVITSPSMIQRGALLGTAAYMSPEQAKGGDADKRSDVWAFGAVLYEMLSGERAFGAGDVAETLAAVLRADSDLSRLPPSTPAALRKLVARCLERNVTRRLRDIGEARITLEDLDEAATLAVPPVTDTHKATRRRRPVVITATLVGSLAVAAGIWFWPSSPATEPSPVTRFVLSTRPDQGLLVDPQSRDLAITPDGTRVVYKGGARVDRTQLFSYALNQLTPQPLTQPGLPKGPFMSPDGQWVGFFEPGPSGVILKKVAITGGPPVEIARLDGPSRGATWGANGIILAASSAPSTGLLRIPIGGGEVTTVTTPTRDRGEGDHLWPAFLPDGNAALYTIAALDGSGNDAQVAVLDLATGTSKTLIRGASQARYIPSGHLLYVAHGALWGVRFDVKRRETTGTAKVVVPEIVTLPTGAAEFDVAQDGTLVYVAHGGSSEEPRTLVWVDRHGREIAVTAPPHAYSTLRLSPDGTRVAVEIEDADNDIWMWDFAREVLTRVTTHPGLDQSPVWMPDSRRLVYSSQADGSFGSLFRRAADGSGIAERLTESRSVQRPSTVLPDGSAILFSDLNGMQILALEPERRVRSVLRSRQASGHGVLSPDGRWLAYVVSDSGSSPQVFVSPFSDPDRERMVVSKDSGTQPRWSPDKPSNIAVRPDGVVKLLDFGIAAVLMPDAGLNQGQTSQSAMESGRTGPYRALGTVAYASPEQVRGRSTDKRTDIWSFGAVLYEVLSGRPAFTRANTVDTIEAVIGCDVDYAALPSHTPPTIRHLLARCLTSDPRQRLQDIGEARIALEPASVQEATEANTTAPNTWGRRSRRTMLIALSAIVVASLAASVTWYLKPSRSFGVGRFTVLLPEGQVLSLANGRHPIAVSSDGTQIVYAGVPAALYRRDLAQPEAAVIKGSERLGRISEPTFSPDGRSIAFHAGGAVRTIPIAGGIPTTIATADAPYGMSWGADGIVFGQGTAGIMYVRPTGHTASTLVRVNDGEEAHGPQLLPGGRHVLFTLSSGTSVDRWEKARIVAQSLESGERVSIIDGGTDARYLPTGHITYARKGTLYAVAFDLKRLKIDGTPRPVLEAIGQAAAGQSGAIEASVSDNGVLVYVPAPAASVAGQGEVFRLGLIDRQGQIAPLPLAPDTYQTPRVSLDGSRISFGTENAA